MQCEIYKSSKKEQMYLYVTKPFDEDDLPDALVDLFGKLTFVMDLEITSSTKLAKEDVAEVIEGLEEKGFYLQMPPKFHM